MNWNLSFFPFPHYSNPGPLKYSHYRDSKNCLGGRGGIPHTNQDPTLNDERLVGPVQQHQTLDPQGIAHRNSFTKCQSGSKSWWFYNYRSKSDQIYTGQLQFEKKMAISINGGWWILALMTNTFETLKITWRDASVMIPPQDVFLPIQNLGHMTKGMGWSMDCFQDKSTWPQGGAP